MQSRSTRVKTVSGVYPHEAAFKPSRGGYGEPIGKFPQHIPRKTSETIDPKRHTKEEGK